MSKGSPMFPRGGESGYIYMISCDINHCMVGEHSTMGTLPLQYSFSNTVYFFNIKKKLSRYENKQKENN